MRLPAASGSSWPNGMGGPLGIPAFIVEPSEAPPAAVRRYWCNQLKQPTLDHGGEGRAVAFVPPSVPMPGEARLASLARGALRVLRGEASAHCYA